MSLLSFGRLLHQFDHKLYCVLSDRKMYRTMLLLSKFSKIQHWKMEVCTSYLFECLSCTTFIRIFFFSLSIGQTQHHARNQEITEGDSINGMAQRSMPKKRYFIIKSLNYHNIEKSIQRGIWATQAMNEPVLNEAFEVGLLLNYASLLYIPFSNFNSG